MSSTVSTGSAWEELVSAALLGTERRPYAAPQVTGELAEVVAEAGDLAGAATALWAYREVGRLPLRSGAAAGEGRPGDSGAGPAEPPAPVDERPLLPFGAVRSLSAIVSEPSLRGLLGEWLGLAAADGRRLPPEWLPVLLDLTPDRLRPRLEAAAGPRAGWLAAQRPDWSAGRGGPVAAALAAAVLAGAQPEWEGPDDDRLAAFSIVRAADPATARRLAERIWPDEPPITRAAMVSRLAAGLSSDDEPFLESRLDDRRKEVRRAAASLLARLPDSRFGARMAGRSRAAVRLQGRARTGLRVEPPAEVDPSARRDGITATAASPDQWVLQVVGATPLGAWPDPDALVEAATGAGQRQLVAAWSLAAERQADPAWAGRLLSAGAPPTAGLLGVLPPDQSEGFVLGWLAKVPVTAAADVLGGLPGPWTARVTDAVMAGLAAVVRSGDHSAPAAALRDTLPRFGLAADPSRVGSVAAAAAALESLPDAARPAARLFWGRALASLNALVHFRQAMHQEFLDR